MVVRKRRSSKSKAVPKKKVIYYQGKGRYTVTAKTKSGVLARATKADKSPGVIMSPPVIRPYKLNRKLFA